MCCNYSAQKNDFIYHFDEQTFKKYIYISKSMKYLILYKKNKKKNKKKKVKDK